MNDFKEINLKDKILNIWYNYKKYVIIVLIVIIILIISLVLLLRKRNNGLTHNNYEAIESIMIFSAENYVSNNKIEDEELFIPLNNLNISIDNSLDCNNNSGVLFDGQDYIPYLMCNDYNSKTITKIIEDNNNSNEYAVLRGDNPYLVFNDIYKEPGYTVEEGYSVNIKNANIKNGMNIVNYYILKNNEYISELQRIVIVEDMPTTAPTIELLGDHVITLTDGDKYIEPGFNAIDLKDGNISSKIKISGTVDATKAGTYILVYSVTNSAGKSTSVSRTIIVNEEKKINISVNHSIAPSTMTHDEVVITLSIKGEGYNYTLLPSNERTSKNTITYVVNTNGNYYFTVFDTNNNSKLYSVKITNIKDKQTEISHTISPSKTTYDAVTITLSVKGANYNYTILPNGSKTSKNTITYVVRRNGKYDFKIFDNNNNHKSYPVTISNIEDQKPEITSVSSKNLIVSVKASKGAHPIDGYYFSTSSKVPSGKESNWVYTPDSFIEVIKIPGTYYVYVKDTKNTISSSKTFTIDNSIIYPTNSSTKLSKSLDSALTSKGYSTTEFNKLLARSVRSAGLYSREAVATSALGFIVTMSKDYGVRTPYYWGGKYAGFGANPQWGSLTNHITVSGSGKQYNHLGLDCSGFIVWAYRNAGFNMSVTGSQYFASHKLSTETGEFGSNHQIGDLIVSPGHITLIVGKYDQGYIVAENGNNIYLHPYNRTSKYHIQTTDITLNNTSLYFPDNTYPSGY